MDYLNFWLNFYQFINALIWCGGLINRVRHTTAFENNGRINNFDLRMLEGLNKYIEINFDDIVSHLSQVT